MSAMAWLRDESAVGIWLCTGSVVVAELAADADFDWALIDLEHGQCSEAEALHLIRVLAAGGCAPIVRLPDVASSLTNRLLDAGAAGLMAPQVADAETAAAFAARLRYAPIGTRGVSSGCRAAGYGTSWNAYRAEANHRLRAMVQIEHPQALGAVDAIAAQPEVDVLFLGHSDLSAALACGPQDPPMLAAEAAVIAACRAHGKHAGLLLKSGMHAADARAKGFSYLALGSDMGCLRSAFTALRATC